MCLACRDVGADPYLLLKLGAHRAKALQFVAQFSGDPLQRRQLCMHLDSEEQGRAGLGHEMRRCPGGGGGRMVRGQCRREKVVGGGDFGTPPILVRGHQTWETSTPPGMH